MTSATGERGHTLLEIIVVMGIIALFAGMFLLRFDSADEEALAEATAAVKAAAVKAKQRAHAYRLDYHLIFANGALILTDRPPPPDRLDLFRRGDGGQEELERFPLPPAVGVELLLPGRSEWKPASGHNWSFRHSGLSDPLSIRLSIGGSHTLLDFPALTALPEEQTIIR